MQGCLVSLEVVVRLSKPTQKHVVVPNSSTNGMQGSALVQVLYQIIMNQIFVKGCRCVCVYTIIIIVYKIIIIIIIHNNNNILSFFATLYYK